jgi:hypothetical protein
MNERDRPASRRTDRSASSFAASSVIPGLLVLVLKNFLLTFLISYVLRTLQLLFQMLTRPCSFSMDGLNALD